MEISSHWHGYGSRMKLLLAILYMILKLAQGQETPQDECKSVHPIYCSLYQEKIELYDNVTACTQTVFKKKCPSLCPPCVVHEHHVNETCFKDVDEDCAKKIAGNKTNCQDLSNFMHCHQTCTECQPSWQAAVLKFIEGENTNSTNSTGGNEEDSKYHSWEEKKELPNKNITLPLPGNSTDQEDGSSEEIVLENVKKGNDTDKGGQEGDSPQGTEEGNDTDTGGKEDGSSSDDSDNKVDTIKCEDSNNLCKTPKLLATFLNLTLIEDKDPCEQTTIQVMCRSTCKLCGDPNAEVPSLEKYREMQKSIGDIWGKLVASFSDFFRKFFV